LIKDLNVRPEILRLLQQSTVKSLQDIGIGNTFLNQTSIAQEIRAKNRKMGLHQIKKLLHSKGNNCQSEEIDYRMEENL
jgi:hypothetical protein